MEFLKIVLLSVAAAVTYGIAHDQVTARICVEYFTVGHPKVIASTSPTLLGLVWGVIATWWVGAILGVLLGLSARGGPPPRLGWRELREPVATLLIGMAVMATIAGISGYGVVEISGLRLTNLRLPDGKQQAFITCLYAHLASYGTAFLGGMTLCVRTVLRRRDGRQPTGAASPEAP
jgi:hypothetical protein